MNHLIVTNFKAKTPCEFNLRNCRAFTCVTFCLISSTHFSIRESKTPTEPCFPRFAIFQIYTHIREVLPRRSTIINLDWLDIYQWRFLDCLCKNTQNTLNENDNEKDKISKRFPFLIFFLELCSFRNI